MQCTDMTIMPPRLSHRSLVVLLLIAFVTLSAGLGLRDPWPADEPRFALVAREMVETGEWLIPHRNGEIYADKPPLFMWMIAVGYAATDSMRVSFLLPSLLAGLVTIALVVDLARRLWGTRPALYAGALLLVCFQFAWQSRAAQIDAVLVAWTTLGLYGLLRHLLLGPSWGWCSVAFLAMGCGVITKGVGFLPVLVLLPWALARWRGARGLAQVGADRAWWGCLLLMLLVIAGWLVPMLVAVATSDDPALIAYRDNILLKQTAKRYATPSHHVKPLWYYLGQIPVLWAPLSLLLPWTLFAWWQRVRRGDARHILLLGWALLVVVFFSLSPGKRGVYIYPALPALAIAIAPLLPGLLRRRDVRWVAMTVLGILAVALLGAMTVVLGNCIPDSLQRRAHSRGIELELFRGLAPFVGMIGAFALGSLIWARQRRALAALAWTLVCGWIIAGFMILPRLNPLRYPADLMVRANHEAGVAGLGMVRFKEQYALAAPCGLTSFGYQRKDADAEMREAIAWLQAVPGRKLMIPDDVLNLAPVDHGRLHRLGKTHGEEWFLAGSDAVLHSAH
jgi:4-amino-4-deoxy-L-arabinose transferase-like glycosyltransferase